MKIITFNANGIRSAAKKGFYTWLMQQDPDILCIQETKAQYHQLIDDAQYTPAPYHCVYADAVKKGYSGVAIYAKQKPQQVLTQLGFDTSDQEGRYIQFDYPKISIASLYLPSGTSGDIRQTIKYQFLEKFALYLKTLQNTGREIIICGDYNIAHRPIDLKNWRANQKNTGFLPEERAWMDHLFTDLGYIDGFRVINQEPEQYTWWSNRGRARENNVGWRIDYQVVTPGLKSSIKSASIYKDQRFS